MYTTNDRLPKLRAEAVLMVRSGKSTREVARYFGYSQSAIVKWTKKAEKIKYNLTRIDTLSSRPNNYPNSLDKEIVAKIIYTRKTTKRCSEVIWKILKKEGVNVSLSSVKRTLDRYGLINKRSPWKKKRTYPPKPHINKPGSLIELDTIHFVDKYNKRNYIYTAIDVFSRVGYAMNSTKSNTHQTIKFLKECIKYFPFNIEVIQTDNGPEFGKYFSDFVRRINKRHRHIHPRSPNENGHLERFNRTIQEEVPRNNLSLFREEHLRKYIDFYNKERLHMGIDFKTPFEVLKESK
jgi:transposase InsO family protein